MTRLARAGWCRARSVPGRGSVAPAFSDNSDARAAMPRPLAVRPKKWRRVWSKRLWSRRFIESSHAAMIPREIPCTMNNGQNKKVVFAAEIDYTVALDVDFPHLPALILLKDFAAIGQI